MCARTRSVHCHTLAQPAKIRVQSQDKMAKWCLGEAFVEAHILLLLVARATNGNCAGRSSISCRVINCSQLRVISRGRQKRTANTHTHTNTRTNRLAFAAGPMRASQNWPRHCQQSVSRHDRWRKLSSAHKTQRSEMQQNNNNNKKRQLNITDAAASATH